MMSRSADFISAGSHGKFFTQGNGTMRTLLPRENSVGARGEKRAGWEHLWPRPLRGLDKETMMTVQGCGPGKKTKDGNRKQVDVWGVATVHGLSFLYAYFIFPLPHYHGSLRTNEWAVDGNNYNTAPHGDTILGRSGWAGLCWLPT